MTFDDGILKIYRTENISEPGMKPVTGLKYRSSHPFGYEAVGINRYYTAMQANIQISELVHIWQDRDITSKDICVMEDGLQYRCQFVQHTENEDGLRITKITLERLNEEYVIREDS